MPGLSSSLRLKDRLCVDSLYIYTLVYLFVCVHVFWGSLEASSTGRSPNYFLDRVGTVSLHLDKTEQTVNRSSWLG